MSFSAVHRSMPRAALLRRSPVVTTGAAYGVPWRGRALRYLQLLDVYPGSRWITERAGLSLGVERVADINEQTVAKLTVADKCHDLSSNQSLLYRGGW